jgi:IS5 family transposase
MLRDRYPIDKLFEEIILLVPKMDRVLAKIDTVLEDEELFKLVYADLAKRWPKTLQTGRNSTPVEVVLRMLVVRRLYGYSYEQTEKQVSDSLILRQFCRVYFQRVPDDTVLIKCAGLIQAETLETFNERITQLATQLQVTQGRKLRTDGTVVETNIHWPLDSWQLADSVRVLERTVRQTKQVLGESGQAIQEQTTNFTHQAKRLSRRISETLRKHSDEAKAAGKNAYQELINMTQQAVQEAQQALAELPGQAGKAADRLEATLQYFLPLAQQVIDQTQRRIFHGEEVPAEEKVLSIFEPHTDVIARGKERHPVEFGHKVWLDEADGGIVTHWRILAGNPNDKLQWQPSLRAHTQTFGHPPEQASADRGVFSRANEQLAQALGVEKTILPKPGYQSAKRKQKESQEWFVQGRKWHAGVEGRISVLKRAHGLGRCLDRGLTGFERWVGWGVIAANLAVIGRTKSKVVSCQSAE